MLRDPVIIATRLSGRVFDIGVPIPFTHALIGDANVLVGLAAAQARQAIGSQPYFADGFHQRPRRYAPYWV